MCEGFDVSSMVYVGDSVSSSPSERNYCVVECTVNRTVLLRVLSVWILDSVSDRRPHSGSMLRYLGVERGKFEFKTGHKSPQGE